MDEKILEELTLMRKELQNIRVILQYEFAPSYIAERERDANGRTINVTRTILEDPLEYLRKRYNITP